MLEKPIDLMLDTQKLVMRDYEVVALDQYNQECAAEPESYAASAALSTKDKLKEIRKDVSRLAIAMASFRYQNPEEELFQAFDILYENREFSVGDICEALSDERAYNLKPNKIANLLHNNKSQKCEFVEIADILEIRLGLEPEDISEALVHGCQATQEDIELVLGASCNLDADEIKEIIALDSVFGEQIKP